jgi:hypothetical protein
MIAGWAATIRNAWYLTAVGGSLLWCTLLRRVAVGS